MDLTIAEIIVFFPLKVALYKYINNEWDKTEIEGTLFVYERQCDPKFGFLILNRRSTNNWIQPIVSDIDTQLQPPFLLYKTKVATWEECIAKNVFFCSASLPLASTR